ncbi:MAG: hypothetical protein RLZZ59_36 [Pseudomonadota bacterium]|jgi:exodeoxyribonuclease VII large subunit
MSIEAVNSLSVNEYSVSELSSKIKQLLEFHCGYVRVRGEISGLKIAASGHGYLNIKDANSILAATCWSHTLNKLKFQIEEGMEVIASGKITSYAGQSRYQLNIENIEPAGVGALMKLLVERKKKLEAEGLFDKSKKKKLPFFPKKIGIVTSITGAVLQDILHRIRDRCPINVLVWPVTVQGDGAAGEISSAIIGFNELPPSMRPEVLIVARGGGSIEDLWCFNEEIVVRAIAASDIPIVSAVGHETDFTLSDFVADVRAPTPTAAAEFVVPVLSDLRFTLDQNFIRLKQNLEQILSHKTKIMDFCNVVLKDPMKLISTKAQTLDLVGFRLIAKIPQIIDAKLSILNRLSSSINNPSKMLEIKSLQLEHLKETLVASFKRYMESKIQKIDFLVKLLDSLDYKNVLSRGFAIVTDKEGEILTSSKNISPLSDLTLRMNDGKVKVTSSPLENID